MIETRYPIVVDRYSFNPEAGVGHGKHRGGFGIVKDYRIVNRRAELTTDINRAVVPPWSMEGGGEGTLNHIVITGEGKPALRVRKISAHRLERGNVVSIRTGAGGGWGNPLDRDPGKVLEDVRAEMISRETARDVYGVVLVPDELAIDEAATATLRESRRAK